MSSGKSVQRSRRNLFVRSSLALGGLAALNIAQAAPGHRPGGRRDDTLADRKSIEDGLVRYATAIDQHDWQGLEEVFAPEVTAYYGLAGNLKGRAALIEVLRKAGDYYGVAQHSVSNFRIAVDGDKAASRCYLQALLVGVGDYKDKQMNFWGEYHDKWERRPEGWRIVDRKLVTLHATGDIGLGGKKES